MSLATDFNIAPYYDDYAESKNYLRVLFRPGYAVQARELTQLQTILQKQSERIGFHFFKQGSKVLGGDIVLNTDVKALKMENNYAGEEIVLTKFTGKQIKGVTSGARGTVLAVVDITTTDPKTFIYRPTTITDFDDGETISTIETSGTSATSVSSGGASGITGAVKDSSIVSISEGVFFVSGFFVFVSAQTIVLDKYSNLPSGRVGLAITETLLSSTDDTSILDNAQGSLNFAAPGADRFKVGLTLATKATTSTDPVVAAADEKFITLMTLSNGNKINEVKTPTYAELEKVLATRTYDESGDYTVRPFGLQVVNNLGGNTSAISAGLEAGKAYVRGHEFETIKPTFIDVAKGRNSQNTLNQVVDSNYGNELILKQVSGNHEPEKHNIIDLHCVGSASINAITADANALTYYGTTKIGTARIRAFEWFSYDTGAANTTHHHSKYRARLYDVRTDTTITGTHDGVSDILNQARLDPYKTASVDGAYIGASITVNTNYIGTTSSDTLNVTDYIVSGGVHTCTFDKNLTQKVLANSTYTLAFDINNVQSVGIIHADDQKAAAANSSYVVKTAHADIAEESKVGQDPAGDTQLLSTDRNTLVFRLPESPAKSIANGVTYVYRKTDLVLANSVGGFNISISGLGSGYKFPTTVGSYSGEVANKDFIVVIKSAASGVNDILNRPITNGQIITFDSTLGRSVTIASQQASVQANTSGSFTCEVIYRVKLENATAKTKSITTSNVSNIQTYTDIDRGQIHISGPSKVPVGKDTLKVADCFNLVRIIDSGNPNNKVVQSDVDDILTNSKDVTSRYTLDTGQRDNFYNHSAIQLKPGAAPPDGQLLVFVDRFTTTGSDAGYYSVTSYPSNVEYNFIDTKTFDYEAVPTYTSPASGDIFDLRDVIDFRPRRADANNAGGANTADDLSSNTATFPSATFGPLGGTSDATSSLTLDTLEFYVGRIDKLALSKDRKFKVISGIAAISPITPPDDEDSMTLYILSIPAYTFNPADIDVKFIDNRRYTMRDIGKLEKRIEKLEYYTALSMLERDTVGETVTGDSTTDTIFNPKGERFKNGILVDNFSGHSVGDVSQSDYAIAVDFTKGEARPKFTSKSFNFSYVSANSANTTTVTGQVGTLSYTSNPIIRQPLQSNTVQINEFNFPSFTGQQKLFPASDNWFATNIRPDVLVNSENQNDHWAFSENNYGHGLHWNDWSEIWSGKQVNPDPYQNLQKSYRSQASRQANLVTQSKTRVGIRTEKIPEAIIRNIGNRTVDLSVVPFIRTQTVYFSTKGLIGSSNVFPFFDDTAYQPYTTPSYNLTLTTISTQTNFVIGEKLTNGDNTAIVLNVDDTTSTNTASLQYHVTYSTGGNDNTAFSSGTLASEQSGLTATIDGSTSVAANAQLVTSIHGETSGKIVIPGGIHRTGERLFRITNSSNNNLSLTRSLSDTVFHAKGLVSTREGQIVSTRPYIVAKDEPNSDEVYKSSVTRDTATSKWINPLSQTFFVNRSNYKNGLFLTSIDLFVETRPIIVDTTSPRFPLSLEIRPVEAQFPSSSKIVPFSQVTLQNDQIVAIGANTVPDVANTTHYTTFTFDAPVYLPPAEYALVIKSASSDYKLYSAVEGQNHRNTVRRIVKPSNLGNLFLPNNADIWEPIPDKFLMVQFNQAQFGASGYLNVKNAKEELSGNTANVEFQSMKFNTNIINFKETSLTTYFKSSNTAGNFDSAFTEIDRDQNFSLEGTRFLEYDSTKYNQDFEANIYMTTSDTNISPVVDLERFNVIVTKNEVNNGELANADVVIVAGGSNYNTSVVATITGGGGTGATITLGLTSNAISTATISGAGSGYVTTPTVTVANSSVSSGSDAIIKIRGESDAQGGNMKSKYISRKVTLEDGFDAKDIRVTLNAFKPQNTDIKVYVKVISAEDTATFDEKEYILLTQETAATTYSLNERDYKDFTFKSANNALSYVSNESTFNRFKTFSIKIALMSSNPITVPRIRDMRTIALDE